MTDFVFNVGKGQVAEFYNRVQTNDGANAALTIVVLATTGLETDVVLKDKANLTLVVAGTTNEVTNANYARIELTDADLAALSIDYVNDRVDLDFADQTWSAVAAGDGWSAMVVCYDPDTTSGTDTDIIPLTYHDFVIVPDGSDITAQLHADGFFRAQ